MKKQKYTLEEALDKLEAYCAKQERSTAQIRKKLWGWGIYGDEAEELISELILANFLSEERFAEAYVRGKFRMNRWGKQKIQQGLQQHEVSEYNIRSALSEIPKEEYEEVLRQLAKEKDRLLPKGLSSIERKTKVTRYLLQKGYDYGDIKQLPEPLNE
jgi:regulatory protein